MRAADLSVYCLALPSLNKIDTYIHTQVKKSLKIIFWIQLFEGSEYFRNYMKM